MTIHYLDPQLAEAYPKAKTAVLYMETAGTLLGNESWWPLIREAARSKGLPLIIAALKGAAVNVKLQDTSARINVDEFDTDDFRRYLMAKLGMM